MTTTTDAVAAHTDHDDGHVSDWVYIKVALFLAFLTAIEVFTYFESVHNMPESLLIITLSVLMVVKFIVVAAYFMHLKYESAWFTKLLASGLALAYPVYMVMAYALGFLPGWSWVSKVALLAVPTIIGSIWLLFAWKGGDHAEAAH